MTGATDGIGLHLTTHLATRGFNVVLAGRNPDKLARRISKLERMDLPPDVQFRAVVADASQSHGMKAAVEGIAADLSGRNGVEKALPGPLTVLVNNVGGMGTHQFSAGQDSGPFRAMGDYAHADVDSVVNLNMRFGVQLTRALLPALLRNQPSLVLNVGSFAGSFGTPHLAVYSGAKSFIRTWSEALTLEMAADGQDVEVLLTDVAVTGGTTGHKGAGSAWTFKPRAEDVARAILERVGCGRGWVAAHWTHAVAFAFAGRVPETPWRLFFTAAVRGSAERMRRERAEAEKRE